MAQTNDHLRDLLEKIKGDAERALALLPSEPELHLHASGHRCGCRTLSEMQGRVLSGAVAHYAVHSARKRLASWRTSLVASDLLPLQIWGDFGELG